MVWQSNTTRDQKEQYVIQLYTEGKIFKEIARLTHMSFRDIGAIIKRHKEEIEGQNGQPSDHDVEPKSKESKAFKLFSEGKSPVEVVVALDLPSDEIRQYIVNFGNFKECMNWPRSTKNVIRN